jgi:hypothetical protein
MRNRLQAGKYTVDARDAKGVQIGDGNSMTLHIFVGQVGLGSLAVGSACRCSTSGRGTGRQVQFVPPVHWPDSHQTHRPRTRRFVDSSFIDTRPRSVVEASRSVEGTRRGPGCDVDCSTGARRSHLR